MPPAPNGAVRRRAGSNFATLQQQQPNFQSKPWFLGAPITKVLCILWAAGSLWMIRSDNTDSETFSNHRNYDYNTNLWGSAVWSGPSCWVFESTSELIFGLSFLGHFLRRLEQELSSRRLVAWLLMLEVVSLFFRLLAVATLDDEVAGAFVSSGFVKGPYLVVGGVLYWYKACVPRLYPRFLSSATLGISCSEKTLPYAWALYILCMRGTASIVVGAIGVLASAIYFFLLFVSTKNPNGNANIPFVDIPDAIVNLLPWESLGGLFFVDASPKVYAPFITRAAMNPRGQRRQRGGGRRAPAPVAEPPIAVAMAVPSPEAVAQLTSMGFEEERVKEALRASDNNVERAANLLLAAS
eukprot:CAMPEP_0116143850 /NCGR_PEP_ID=MMETSP0329-20121206/15669_1 /TAXON_ID=697910 /ORGANISM="Pseudo-nitzschia arenysensis, Strain B593" /LENGTH=353 /DNA_ID=CAMNT_0003639195 /DNA_START=35 /DNA_END=1096 /DNA_ORIENTATION=-